MKTNVKRYTIEVYEEDGQSIISRCNDGFDSIELLGLCEMTQLEVLRQMQGEIKPDIINRTVFETE